MATILFNATLELGRTIQMWLNRQSITAISLDAAGVIALADLTTIAERTALTGSASLLDILLLTPGIHLQQKASEINGGELPSTGAMTSGFVFRVENQATVAYLQKIGRTGSLVTVQVEQNPRIHHLQQLFSPGNSIPSIMYCTAIVLTILVLAILSWINSRLLGSRFAANADARTTPQHYRDQAEGQARMERFLGAWGPGRLVSLAQPGSVGKNTRSGG